MFDPIPILKGLKPHTILLLQACLIMLIPFALWRGLGLRRIVPLSVVQTVVGVLLGPAVLGLLFPDFFKALFGVVDVIQDSTRAGSVQRVDGIGALAMIAACLYGFLAGADADKKVIEKSGPAVAVIGVVGMLLGLGLATIVGYGVHVAIPSASLPGSSAFAFAVTYGLIVAVSAPRVLALILRDLELTGKRIGAVALAGAGIAESIMWIGLAICLALSVFGGSVVTALVMAGIGAGLTFVSIKFVAGPVLDRMLDDKAPETAVMTLAVFAIFVAAALTSITDLHPVLGAFIAGIFLPDRVRALTAQRLDQPTMLVLMPFFFLATGLRTTSSIADPELWMLFGSLIILCLAGKALAHAVAARLTGEPWPFALSIGVLLQTKGLMGLMVANVLFDKGVIAPLMFSAVVLMCIVSNSLPMPLLRWAMRTHGAILSGGSKAEPPVDVTAAPATSRNILARLEFEGDRDPISITKPSAVIGRHTTDDIRIDDVRISRSHILLTIAQDGRARIRNQTADRSDPNPVTVNGVYQEDAEIKDGDRIGVGGMTLVFREALDAAARRAHSASA
jgi:Kef-type K+ transport system membrane component KefB